MVNIMEKKLDIKLCDYGCGQTARYQFKNGKWCCSENQNSCPEMKRKNSKLQQGEASAWYGKKHTIETKQKIRNINLGKKLSKKTKQKIGNSNRGKTHTDETKKKISLASSNITRNTREKMRKSQKGRKHPIETKQKIGNSNRGKTHTDETKKKISLANKGRTWSIIQIKSRSLSQKLTISKIKKRYPFFSRIEKMRYNPDKPGEKEIQVHCKNHNCKNSKEHGGWFTPTSIQFSERIRQIENQDGNDGSYFYCSDECKNACPLYNLRSDPFKEIESYYTQSEYQIFRQFVLERDDYICQYCGEKAEHVHHERPQKLEPFFALDPDFAWSCCEKCHYEKGHKDECSTGSLAKKEC